MGLQSAILFSLLAVQALAAPQGCIESCTSYHRTYQTQNGYQDHAALTQPTAALSELAYVRPGNWTEENHYRTDGGHGNVHEERGQYETGPKRVRYYKKNYTASYSSGNTNGLSEAELNRDRFGAGFTGGSQQLIDTQRGYNQYGNTRTTAEQHEYNRIHSERTSSSRVAGESAHLEDFGTYGGNSQVSHRTVSGLESHNVAGGQFPQPASETLPQNWSRVDSYRTDGGNGRVHEEEGQYVTGPKKVRYFKRNYTSSYTSGGIPVGVIPEHTIPTVGTHDIHTELEKLQRELGREMQHLTNTAHRETGFNTETTGFTHTNVQPIATNQQVISSVHRNEEEHLSSTNGVVRPILYVNPTQRVYATESHNSYERHEGYQAQPERQYVSPTSDYSRRVHDRVSSIDRTSLTREEEERRTHEQLTRGDIAGIHQTNVDSLINSDLSHGNTFSQQVSGVPTRIGQGHHYKEHWSSASHTREGTFPPVSTDSLHVNQESAQYNRHQQYNNQHSAQNVLGHNFHSGYGGSSMDIGHAGHTADCTEEHAEQVQYGSRYHRNYKRSANYPKADDQLEQKTDNAHPELSGFEQQSVNTRDAHLRRHSLHAGNKPKYSNEVDDLTQQTTGRLEFGLHPQRQREEPSSLDEFSQQSEHDTQKPSFPSISKPYSDFSQQRPVPPTTASLEYGRAQRERNPEPPSVGDQHYGDLEQQNEDLSQVSSGFGEFGRYPYGRKPTNEHLEDLTETGIPHDFSQQSNSGLEFGQQTQNSWTPSAGRHSHQRHRGQYFSQRDEDLTRQTGDFDDLTQQTGGFDDFSQQTSGKLEFGQHTRYPGEARLPESSSQHRDDAEQHDEDFSQQTGKLDFGQEIPYPREPWNLESHHRDNLSQQSHDLTEQTAGKLEFGQQSLNPPMIWKPESQHRDDLAQQTEDLAQQTSGKLEFGQQTQHPEESWRPESHHRGDLSQQTQDSTHHTSGKLEFGQQTSQDTWTPTANDHQDETQQWDDLSQQTSGKLELGQQTENGPDYWKPASASQHREDFTQQTGDFDDLSQQTSGKLELGQQTENGPDYWKPASASQHREDFTQQTGDFDDLSQQTSGKLELGQQTQEFKPWDQLADLTQKNEDFTQQTSGNLEFGRRPGTQVNQENEDLSQQTGHFEFGQFQQQAHRPSTINTNGHVFESQRNSDMNQQTQQEDANIFQHNDNQRWDFLEAANLQKQESTQQTLEFGSQKPVPGAQTEEPAGVLPLENQFGNTPQQPSTGLKPAEKPKPRPRYSRPVTIESTPIPNSDLSPVYVSPTPAHDHPRTEDLRADQELGTDEPGKNTNKQVPISAFNAERGNGDQESWLHRSNDATVGLQWHYNYHPSDLTNSEPLHSSYFPQMNYNSHDQERHPALNREHSQPINPDQQVSEHGQVFDSTNSQSTHQSENQENSQVSYIPPRLEPGVKGHRRPNLLRQTSSTVEPKLQPRILEAYGGGPYDSTHNEDIYSRVTPNPSATLPPLNSEDPWDIREKPREPWGTTIVAEIITDSTPETTEATTVTPPTFWGRLGHKITNTFDKARDKARGIFG